MIEEHRPQLVLVLLGGNDFLHRMPERAVRNALRHCVDSARSSKVAIALIAVPRFSTGGLANAPLYEEAGREWDVPIVESGLASLLGRSATRADPIHLNAAGYREMAMTIAESLRSAGLLTR